jgi:hypothetical protein
MAAIAGVGGQEGNQAIYNKLLKVASQKISVASKAAADVVKLHGVHD